MDENTKNRRRDLGSDKTLQVTDSLQLLALSCYTPIIAWGLRRSHRQNLSKIEEMSPVVHTSTNQQKQTRERGDRDESSASDQ